MRAFIEQQRHELIKHLRANVEGEVRFDPTTCKLYSTDASIYQIEPMGVVIPRSVADVVATVQIAEQMRIAITPRGGGTSLSGQSIGPGIVLDCSKYLNQVLELDPPQRIARVQPGVVLDSFNRLLEPSDLQFGPDVSTSSRANLGGLMGNNSAGARSIVYGKTIDHVLQQTVILSDGSTMLAEQLDDRPRGGEGQGWRGDGTSPTLDPRCRGDGTSPTLDPRWRGDGTSPTLELRTSLPDEWEAKARLRGREGEIYRTVRAVVKQHRDEIHRRFPRLLRRVSGYNLDVLADVPLPRAPLAPVQKPGLHHLLVGSEGTLGIVVEAVVHLAPRPRVRGLLVPQFETLAHAMEALQPCLEFAPSAVEVMDQLLLELTAGNLALRDATKPIDRRAKAIFLVEFSGESYAEVEDRVEKLRRRLQETNGLVASVPALDPAIRDPLWNLRRASMPLLYGMVGDAKPITFVEDPAVPPEKLPEFVQRFREILHRYGTDGSFYGHASVGCLHIRPVMNLKDPAHVANVRRIMEEVSDLVLLFGGSLSGEHGDGLSRSEWNRKMFGNTLYEAFREVKRAFDPHGIFNPGRIVEAPPMTENLRYPPNYRPAEPVTVFDYSRQEGFLRSIETCNGSGACRKTTGGTMCPSYRATMDERDSTRGRANALRHALAINGPMADPRAVPRTLRQRWVHEVFDLCLMCKACKSECPSNVDVGKHKAEFLQFYYRGRSRPLEHLLVAGIPWFNSFASSFAPVVNWLQSRRLVRWTLEIMAGIDRRRSLPPLHRDHFRKWFRRHRPDSEAGKHGKVLLLADCFTTYNEPAIGAAAVRVLERAGYAVELADLFCCGRVFISKGFLHLAQARVQAQVGALARRVADGTPLLGLEPSCLLTLSDDWPELFPGEETRSVARAARLADGWLSEQIRTDRCSLPLTASREQCLVHEHCHQKALLGIGTSAAALRLIPGLDVSVVDAGCCGMAGSFGFEQSHFDVSEKIANLALLPALQAEPDRLAVASGTSCRHQIHDLAERKALHPMEMLAAHLDLDTTPRENRDSREALVNRPSKHDNNE